MTTILEEAFRQASELSPAEQDTLGAILLAELASEKRWAEAFEQSREKLAKLAGQALGEFDSGKTKPLDLDKL